MIELLSSMCAGLKDAFNDSNSDINSDFTEINETYAPAVAQKKINELLAAKSTIRNEVVEDARILAAHFRNLADQLDELQS